ncbi:MAG: methionine--tRNA ligase [Verrucomicrobiota bacterium]|nr:methionine--tRNA ligase [Verrucomicrobiota bacterium]
MPERFYLCTAIDYTNGAPHIGHAYEKVLGDVLARYYRLAGEDVFFLTGVDQHGQKVQQSAEKQGIAPEEFVAQNTAKFEALWQKLGVQYDGWAATVEPRHKTCVQQILQRLWDEKQIYKDKQAGYYSVRQEQFLTDKERNAEGEFGPEWGQVEFREEENYYFRLAEHKEWLLALIEARADLIYPDFRRGELRNAVEKLSGDLCISRPKSRLGWGIELPFDREFVTYVWFDALVNYISFAPGGYDPHAGADAAEFHRWWPATIIIGKDILIPAHGIYWMIMLHALGFSDADMPRLIVHGWWNIGGAKMSKSEGNVVDPALLADKYGAEALRYYLMADIATGRDADFAEDRLVSRYNSELANSIGNLLNRSLSMAHRYRDGRLRRAGEDGPLRGQAENAVAAYRAYFADAQVNAALAAVNEFVTACNTYVETTAPWKLAKDPERADTLDNVLYALAESLRIVALLLSPVLPKASRGIFEQLNCAAESALDGSEWGGLPDGHTVGKPTPLFPRIEPAAV